VTPRSLRPHPARDAILDAMRQHGAPMSPVQLARITGATLGSTAYHVRTLATAGVIELVGESAASAARPNTSTS
jgi:Helix-turn-helix domain